MLLEACDIDAIEDAAVAFMPESRRKELRYDEIIKLEQMMTFEGKHRSLVPKDTRILFHKWVETTEKARLTAADKKSYGQTNDLIHCPTPSAVVNNAMEALASSTGRPMLLFDVASAFPHADEEDPNVWMYPPKELVELNQAEKSKFGT